MNADKEQELINKYRHLLDPVFVDHRDGLGFIQVTDGWTHIIEGLLGVIESHRKYVDKELDQLRSLSIYKEPFKIKISSIKEKFSSLRIYYEVNDEHKQWTQGAVSVATELASMTCECCSTTDTKKLGMTTGWLTVICSECYDMKAQVLEPDWAKRNLWMNTKDARKHFNFFFQD